jgi:hypothetical protein
MLYLCFMKRHSKKRVTIISTCCKDYEIKLFLVEIFFYKKIILSFNKMSTGQKILSKKAKQLFKAGIKNNNECREIYACFSAGLRSDLSGFGKSTLRESFSFPVFESTSINFTLIISPSLNTPSMLARRSCEISEM